MSEAQTKRKYESPRQIARQSKILAAARDLLDEGGYDGLTMRGLARKAGVAQGTLYNLYGSKDDLIHAAVDDLLIGLTDNVRDQAPKPGIDTILTQCRVFGESMQLRPAYTEAMTRIVLSTSSDSPLVDLVFARNYPTFRDNLAVAERAGELAPDTDIDLIAKHLTGNGWSVTLLWLMGKISLDAMVTERDRNMLLTLISITQGQRQADLQRQLRALS